MAKVGAATAVSPMHGVAADADTVVRTVLFVITYFAVWISFHPFQSLAEPPHAVTEGGDPQISVC